MNTWKYKVLLVLSTTAVLLGATCVSNQNTNLESVGTNSNQLVVNSEADSVSPTPSDLPQETTPVENRPFSTQQLPEVDEHFQFSASLPTSWSVEYIPDIQALNFFDPSSPEDSTLEQSQLFVRYFVASEFLTLQTVNIYSRTPLEIQGYSAMVYDIEKLPGVANFPYQPSWRNERHKVTDIRLSDQAPSTFLVFARRPSLNEQAFDQILKSLDFEHITQVVLPIDHFFEQASLKTFGTYITPETSPVQPERFSGYHTGVDVETTPAHASQDVPVFAISQGTVSLKKEAQGYGGVVIINHQIDGQTYSAVYGHLDLTSISVEVGDSVTAGQQIGVLGEGFTQETDGERKHLHFGLLVGDSTALLGYVDSQDQLDAWVNPISFFEERGLSI